MTLSGECYEIQKKTLILNLYGNDYFGKDRTLRRGHVPRKLKSINLSQISANMQSFAKKGDEINLDGYKILAEGELSVKLKIKASAASKSAIEKIKKSGGEIILPSFKQEKKAVVAK